MIPPITYIIQIGNSDNRLPQAVWSSFIDELGNLLARWKVEIHFFGCSNPVAPWQNCCAVFEHPENRGELEFKKEVEATLSQLAWKFDQDSIALTYGYTGFIEAAS
jgi:hypothetical protein